MTKTNTAAAEGWRNRIVGEGEVPAGELVPHPQNWRKHPKEQGGVLTQSLDGVGWVQRVIVNKRSGRMLDGHLRAELARRQGEATLVPVVYVDLSDDEERTVLATLDPIAGMAIADEATLAGLVRSIEDADLRSVAGTIAQSLNVDADGKGDAGKDTEPQIDRAEELRQKWGVEPGQLWQLGEHRLICGDCTDAAVVARVMGGERFVLVTEPPYGIRASAMTMGSHQSSLPKEQRLSNVEQWDDKRPDMRPFVNEGLFSCVWGGQYFARELPVSDDWLCWHKKNDNLSFAECELAWTNYGARTRILQHHWGDEKKQHITQKPLAVMQWATEMCPDKRATVLDPFLGSGTTLIACENLGRRCRAVEIAPGYVAVALERWATHTGETPVLINE